MKKRLLLIAVCLAVSIGAVITYWQIRAYYKHQELISGEREISKKAVARSTSVANNMLSIEAERNNETYAQLFSSSEDRLKEIDSDVIAVGGSIYLEDEKDAALAYMRNIEDLIRLNEMRYRKSMEVTSAIESLKSASEDYTSSEYSEYLGDYERRRFRDTANKAKDAFEESKKASKSYLEGVKSFSDKLGNLRKRLPGYSLISDGFLQKSFKESSANEASK